MPIVRTSSNEREDGVRKVDPGPLSRRLQNNVFRFKRSVTVRLGLSEGRPLGGGGERKPFQARDAAARSVSRNRKTQFLQDWKPARGRVEGVRFYAGALAFCLL